MSRGIITTRNQIEIDEHHVGSFSPWHDFYSPLFGFQMDRMTIFIEECGAIGRQTEAMQARQKLTPDPYNRSTQPWRNSRRYG